MGHAFHSLVEAVRKGRNPDAVIAKALAALPAEASAADAWFNPAEGAPSQTREQAAPIWAWARGALDAYHAHYQNAPEYERFSRWIAVEETMVARLRNAAGRRTSKRLAGKVDGVAVRADGSVWIVDTKTTSLLLDTWKRQNGTSPQMATYAVLVRERYPDIQLAGACYDLVSTKPCGEVRRNKDGSLAAPGSGLLSVTAAAFAAAVQSAPGGWKGKDWYEDQYNRLVRAEAEGRWFRREFVTFSEYDLERAAEELAAIATKHARMRRDAEPLREYVRNGRNEGGVDGDRLVTALVNSSTKFPRQPAVCTTGFGFRCDYYDLCHSLLPDAARELQLTETAHVELDNLEDADTATTGA
jgi:RecB family exonuclease